jgi:hypothetical protein
MKISPPRAADAVARLERISLPKATANATADIAAGSAGTLSAVGSVTSDLRAKAAEHGTQGDIRPDFVAEMKAEIEAGRLGSPADVERAIDALLQEL